MAIETVETRRISKESPRRRGAKILEFPLEKIPDWIYQKSGTVKYPVDSPRRSVEIGFSKFSPDAPTAESDRPNLTIVIVNGFSMEHDVRPMKRLCHELANQCEANVYSIDTKPAKFNGDPNDDEGKAVSWFVRDLAKYNGDADPRDDHIILAGNSRGNMAAIKAYGLLEKAITAKEIKGLQLEPLVVTHYLDNKSLAELTANVALDIARSVHNTIRPQEGVSRLQAGKVAAEVYGAAALAQTKNILSSKVIGYPRRLLNELHVLENPNPAAAEIRGPVIIEAGLDDPHGQPGRNSNRSLKDRMLGRNQFDKEALTVYLASRFPNSSEVTVYTTPHDTHIGPVVAPERFAQTIHNAFKESRNKHKALQTDKNLTSLAD